MSARAGVLTRLWDFLDYGAGVLSLVSLTGAVLWGLAATDRTLLASAHRLAAQGVHRGLAVAGLGFLGLHVWVKVARSQADGAAVVLPFADGDRPLLIGLGTLAGYLFVAVAVSGAVRSAFATRGRSLWWRALHMGAYPAWGASLVHGLKSGRAASGWVTAAYALCLVAVAVLLAVRLRARLRTELRAGTARPPTGLPPAPAAGVVRAQTRGMGRGAADRAPDPAVRPRGVPARRPGGRSARGPARGPAVRAARRCPGAAMSGVTRPVLGCVGQPRLLAGLDAVPRLDRAGHLAVHGVLPAYPPDGLVGLAEDIGLRGRGGAGFPFARKLRAVARSARGRDGRSAVVVNASEGEPSCLKDAALLLHVPHLVLDGALLAAAALGAEDVVVGVTRADVEQSLGEAVAERGPAGRRVRVVRLPERFVTGEGTSLVRGLDGGPALPSGQKVRTSERGLGGLPTLLSNAETYAQLAVAARLGAPEYRTAGLPAEPGTTLLTVAGSTVVEVPLGTSLAYVLDLCGTVPGQGVLVGGFHGRWLAPADAREAVLSRQSLAAYDAVLGAGAVLPLPEDTCPAGEVARVARWMADESAGQCGPCVRGLPSLADAVEQLVAGGGGAALDAVQARMRGCSDVARAPIRTARPPSWPPRSRSSPRSSATTPSAAAAGGASWGRCRCPRTRTPNGSSWTGRCARGTGCAWTCCPTWSGWTPTATPPRGSCRSRGGCGRRRSARSAAARRSPCAFRNERAVNGCGRAEFMLWRDLTNSRDFEFGGPGGAYEYP